MLAVLNEAIERLPELLATSNGWQSLHITYHPPRVERLWLQHGSHRVFLHRIYPCRADEALWHPHPWPSAVRIVAGRYEHAVSLADPSATAPPRRDRRVLLRSLLTAGSEYALTDRDSWHAVRPVAEPVDSVMLIGTPYDPPVSMPAPPKKPQSPLSEARMTALKQHWLALLDAQRA